MFLFVCFVELLLHAVDPLKLSGLLENDDIVVSRRANSYVLTSVGSGGSSVVTGKKKLHNTKLRANGLETMLKKAGAGNFSNFHRLKFEIFEINANLKEKNIYRGNYGYSHTESLTKSGIRCGKRS